MSIEDDSKEQSTSFGIISNSNEDIYKIKNCSVDLVAVKMEADEEEVEPTPELKQEDQVAIVDVQSEETIPDKTVCNLEQQLSDVALNETQKEEEEPQTTIEEELKKVEDIEMIAEPEEQIADEASALSDEPLTTKEEPNETQVVTQEQDETLVEKVFDFMDFEDLETPLRRRSRRLQTTQVEIFPVKTEEPVSTPIVVETKKEPFTKETVVWQSPLKEEVKFESTSPQPVPEDVQELIEESQPQLELRIEYTDERLKRYETIRDNIYPKKSDKKVCKVNKTMKCDCTITEEEVKSGDLGCQFNCINRLLYIECGSKCRCGGKFCSSLLLHRLN